MTMINFDGLCYQTDPFDLCACACAYLKTTTTTTTTTKISQKLESVYQPKQIYNARSTNKNKNRNNIMSNQNSQNKSKQFDSLVHLSCCQNMMNNQ